MKAPVAFAFVIALLLLSWVVGPKLGEGDQLSGGVDAASSADELESDRDRRAASPEGDESPGRELLSSQEVRHAPPPDLPSGAEGPLAGRHPRDSQMARDLRRQNQLDPELPLPPGMESFEVQVFNRESSETVSAFLCSVRLVGSERPPVNFHLTADRGIASFPVPRDQTFDLHVEAPGFETAVLSQLGFEFKQPGPLQVGLVPAQ